MKIKTVLKKSYGKTYSLDDIDDIIKTISEKVEKPIKKTRKIVSKYSQIEDDTLSFDVTKSGNLTYDIIKRKIDEQYILPVLNEHFNNNDNDSDNDNNNEIITRPIYCPLKENEYESIKKIQLLCDNQNDDIYTNKIEKLAKIVDELSSRDYPKQRSPEWFKQRDGKITASDVGTIIGDNGHELPYKFILKKINGSSFSGNIDTYHGKKFEAIATMIYEFRMMVRVSEYGLVEHQKYTFLGASPDGITSRFKTDGKSKTKNVGRMLEIKCPSRRVIKSTGEIKGNVCPIYYWDQVQFQLECCDLEECDFLQCKIEEYDDKSEFVSDTNPNEPYKSLSSGMEKGCILQLLPINKGEDIIKSYNQTVYDNAMWIYPPKVMMTPYEYDRWIISEIENLKMNYEGYYLDRIIYWKLSVFRADTILRDRIWFAEKLPIFQKMWGYVMYLRNHPDKKDLMNDYIQKLYVKMNVKEDSHSQILNKNIMDMIEKLCCESNKQNKIEK